MADTPAPSQASVAIARWRDRLLDGAVLAIPTALVTQGTSWIQGRFLSQPWQILWVALPIAVLAFLVWKTLRRPGARRMDLRFIVFLILYASAFAVASTSDLLVWKRVPVKGFEGETSRQWLLPASWGDWRYWVVGKAPFAPRLTVLLEDHHAGQDKALTRVFDAQIIQAAANGGARGVFFDASFAGHTAADPVLCGAIAAATAARIPVMSTYRLAPVPNTPLYAPDPPADAGKTPACLLETAGRPVYRAHSMVFADVDGRVRSIPVNWNNAMERSALSVRIAQCMKSDCAKQDLTLPAGMMLHYLPASTGDNVIRGDDAIHSAMANPGGFADRFLLIGEHSPMDVFPMPTEQDPSHTPGTLIHAYAVGSLLSGKYFSRPPAWFTAFILVAVCGVLALFAAQNASPRKLLVIAAIGSGTVVLLAAAVAALYRVWLDVIYPLVALWLLLPLLLAYRRVGQGG